MPITFGLGEGLAITGLVMQVVAAINAVIEIFEKAQNAPRELEELRCSLLRLHDNFDQIRAQDKKSGSRHLHEYDIDGIQSTLEDCKALFENYAKTQSANGVLRAVWGTQNHDEVVRYQALVDRHFWQILLPFWMKTLCSTVCGPQERDRSQAASVGTLIVRRNSGVPPEQLDSLAMGFEQLKNDENPDEVKGTLQRLDRTLRECWQALGLPITNPTTPLSTTIPPTEISFTTAPTILTLEIAPENYKKIRLHQVHIMARDNTSRILLYQNKENTVRVTQIIPFGCIPWTPKKSKLRVSFLKPYVVTVIDGNEHHMYEIDPKYRFATEGSCRRFQETLRERDHLGAFDFVTLCKNGHLLSCRQVLRFWRRDKVHGVCIVTMTFLYTPDSDVHGHEEYDVSMFRSRAILASSSRNPLKSRQTNVVQLLSNRVHPATNIWIQFDTVKEATAFKDFFDSTLNPLPQHNLSLPSPTLDLFPLPSPTHGWSSTEATPSDSTWQENAQPKVEDLDVGPAWNIPWSTGSSSRSRASTVVVAQEAGNV